MLSCLISAQSCLAFATSVFASVVMVATRSGGDLLKKSMILACFIWELKSPILDGLIASASSESLRFLCPFPLLVATVGLVPLGQLAYPIGL
uniref:Uncharacterized protein n=1 Tax=Anopheles darlingi TaxID=43151 RepID=A0A2M4DDL2_ANODA